MHSSSKINVFIDCRRLFRCFLQFFRFPSFRNNLDFVFRPAAASVRPNESARRVFCEVFRGGRRLLHRSRSVQRSRLRRCAPAVVALHAHGTIAAQRRAPLHAAAVGRSAPCERTDRRSEQESSRTEDCVLFEVFRRYPRVRCACARRTDQMVAGAYEH